MKRIMTSATGRVLAVFLSLALPLLNVSLAEAQGDGTTGLMAAGVYVEEVEQEPGQEPSVQGRVVVLYADGNWTLYDPTAISPMYGIWEEAGGTSTGTDTDTDTSTDTGTDTGAVTLDGTLFDPNTGDTTSYTLEFDQALTSLTLTNGTPEATFTRIAIGTDTGTDTSTSTDTGTDTSTSTDTGTETSTSTDTGTETSTSTSTTLQ